MTDLGNRVMAQNNHNNINEISDDEGIAKTNKFNAIFWGIMRDNLALDEVKVFLENYPEKEKRGTDYRRLLCAYDFKINS